MPDNRETLQVNQPSIINVPETNWPDPLVDPSNKLRVAVTNGSNGTQSNKDLVSTSQQDRGEHHLAEGGIGSAIGDQLNQGSHANKFQTSQQNAGEHSPVEEAEESD